MTNTPTASEELAKDLQELIRFLIEDHAFDKEFLVTAVQEYYNANRKPQKS